MIARCTQPGTAGYESYGGRGISVADRWMEFDNFLMDMGVRPSMNHSIDRLNTNGDYEPGNCRWATPKEQQRNKRSNLVIDFRGESKCLAQWADEFGLEWATLRSRLRHGWDVERALTTPLAQQFSHRGRPWPN
jgi:hypothetical protein